MKLELQVPLYDIQYSVNKVTLDDPTETSITEALSILSLVNDTYKNMKNGTTKRIVPTIDTTLMQAENKQLKQFQEQGQDFMNRIKNKDPELFKEIVTEMEAADVHDNEANARVDDKILDEAV